MHYISKTIKHGLKLGTGSPQGPAGTGSEGRLWWPEQPSLHQTLSSNYSHFVTQISLITTQGKKSKCKQVPRSANQHQICEKLRSSKWSQETSATNFLYNSWTPTWSKKSRWIVGLATQAGTQEVCYEMDRHMNENTRLSFNTGAIWIVLSETLAIK